MISTLKYTKMQIGKENYLQLRKYYNTIHLYSAYNSDIED